MSRWRREQPVLAGFREEWADALTRAGVPAGSVGIEIEPAAEPGPDVAWNWWLSFSLGEFAVDAIVAEGLGELAFEDESGRFEDVVAPGEVAGYLLERVSHRENL
ncbi:hypothetical protein [Amycolatopsis sp. NPDC004625]|uniref:hypothetical protein n=1 Tax=Amycolatopsis sp. NPDC004625 TaxID=3154670 RepID=UPI0033BC8163